MEQKAPLFFWGPVWPPDSEQTDDEEDAVFHAVSPATYHKPTIMHMIEHDTHDKNDHMTDAGGNDQAADDQRNAGSQMGFAI